jgi:hypothetical protein
MEFATLNNVVFAPMPSASVAMATAKNPGLLFKLRSAWRRSVRKSIVSMKHAEYQTRYVFLGHS